MKTVAVILKPVDHGWAVALTDGREVARFTGPGARWRATRYIAGRGFSHAL
jgi:hypothetical protein